MKLYLTFHAYGNLLLYPWGFTTKYPKNREQLHSLAVKVNEAIKSVRGTSYQIGSSTNVLYAAAGGSDDWFMGVNGVPLTYTMELPGGGFQGFDLQEKKIKPIVRETFQGIKVFAKYIRQTYGTGRSHTVK